MRTAFATALALSLSLAAVRADETPEPILSDSVSEPATLVPSKPADPPRYGSNNAADDWIGPEESVLKPAPAPAPPSPPKVCVMLKAESFEIKTNNKPRPMSAEPMAYLICDNITTTSTAGGETTLKCTNCKLTLPNGVSATANDVAFDSKTNVLMLTGTDESPVTVTMAGTESKAAKIEMKINPRNWESPVRQPSANAVSSRY
jgi:hypothetical protein